LEICATFIVAVAIFVLAMMPPVRAQMFVLLTGFVFLHADRCTARPGIVVTTDFMRQICPVLCSSELGRVASEDEVASLSLIVAGKAAFH